jgi:hypothetical protein
MPALPSKNATGSAIPSNSQENCVPAFRVMQKTPPETGRRFLCFPSATQAKADLDDESPANSGLTHYPQ